MDTSAFLPVSKEDMTGRGWWWYDFLLVTGDAYVDHPTFGAAVIGRVLAAEGYRVAVLAQPDWHSAQSFAAMGRPRLGVLIGAGNLDSMVAHYTAAKKRRGEDFYSPGKKAGLRPDRAVIVYANRAREAFPDCPIIIGGLEASLRRFAHYDYWDDAVRRSVLVDSGADLLVYGMGETATREIAAALKKKRPISSVTEVRGTAYLTKTPPEGISLPSFEAVRSDRRAYARATMTEYAEHDPIRGRTLLQAHGERTLVVNPPAMPLDGKALDAVAELPYTRTYHPMYEALGGVPAIDEVRFSITHNRGCFGGCNFCAIAFHQGRSVRSRSVESCVEEAELLASLPDFKGYIHDVGGPTANFRNPACEKQLKHGVCPDRRCLFPKPCPNLRADHTEYVDLLERLEAVPGVKKVFIRSGIRFDYMMADPSDAFFRKLVRDHVSGQLKVAPEHCAPNALRMMGKPSVEIYDKFREKFFALSAECGKEQYLVPYLMSSHPGCTMDDAARLAVYTKRIGLDPEQVQDFYPTPGTASTVMYYTGLDPFTGKEVYTATDYHEKQLQRALLQWRRPENRRKIREAMEYCTPAGVKDLEELLSGSPGIHRPPQKEEEPAAGRKRSPDAKSPAGRRDDRRTGTSRGGNGGHEGRSGRQNGKPFGKQNAPGRGGSGNGGADRRGGKSRGNGSPKPRGKK